MVASGGGQSWICGDQILGGADDDSLVESFQSARAGDYAEMRAQLADLGKRAARAKSPTPAAEIDATLARLRERWEEIRAIDFLDSLDGREAEAMIGQMAKKVDRTAKRRKRVPDNVRGKTWVTRAGIRIDRIASAWLILRHIDPDARFRFVEATRWARTDDEIAFDIVGGEIGDSLRDSLRGAS